MTKEELLEAVGRIEKNIVAVADIPNKNLGTLAAVEVRMKCIAALREAQELRMDIKKTPAFGRKSDDQKA